MVMEKEMSVPVSDLRYLSIECECGTKVTIDLGHAMREMRFCPMCNKEYDPHAGKDFHGLASAYGNASQGLVKYKLSFRIPLPETKT
jgi:hypothetical protein